MEILVPIDGSDPSRVALEFAIDLVGCFDGSLHVIHFSDAQTDATDEILDSAADRLDEAGIDDDPELLVGEASVRRADGVGESIVAYVEEHGYDHVVMGHHGRGGPVERAILGSAAEAVVRSGSVSATVIPRTD